MRFECKPIFEFERLYILVFSRKKINFKTKPDRQTASMVVQGFSAARYRDKVSFFVTHVPRINEELKFINTSQRNISLSPCLNVSNRKFTVSPIFIVSLPLAYCAQN